MKIIQKTGLIIFIAALALFTIYPFIHQYKITPGTVAKMENFIQDNHKAALLSELKSIEGNTYSSKISFFAAFREAVAKANQSFDKYSQINGYWLGEYQFRAAKYAATGSFIDKKSLFSMLIFIGGMIGALMYIIPLFWEGPAGIKHNNIYHNSATNAGIIGIIAGIWMVGFYIILYFYPHWMAESVSLSDGISEFFNDRDSSQWFVYGLLYSIAVTVMGLRMFAKYRHNRYHIVRTISVIFFQLGFAFILPQILYALQLPEIDLKNIWPLDYSFFYDYRLDSLVNKGTIGWVMLFWGLGLIVFAVPLMTYFFGKRWYCSWVCGCGGLAETLGDPYRQLSSKKLSSWKIERYLIHGVLVFAVIMTGFVLYHYFSGSDRLMGISAYDVRKYYGLGISSIFAGVVGTGFYPILGNRVWCRFGCPLAALFGIIQRFKSRFRITTNGGQCISCGNCSTYCEQGIDVRWYAQRGQDIVRASCVGCGVCSAVCPRGVLRLENGDPDSRVLEAPLQITGSGIEPLK